MISSRHQKELLKGLPDTTGVYSFFDARGVLLYVGKSKHIRSRVRSHFTTPEEAALCRQVHHIDVRETAGELGALLLELQCIKELRPIYNIRSRQRRRIVVARQVATPAGYARIVLEAVDRIDPGDTAPLMAIFKTNTQARTSLADIARTHRLCLKLLGLERTSRHCFGYHLGYCDGACGNEEDAASYNARVERAFAERRIRAWPFNGPILIEERIGEGEEGEVFLVDNWCLLYSFAYSHREYKLNVRGPSRFDYDSYRVLVGYVFDALHSGNIRCVEEEEFAMLMKLARAA